MFATKAWNLGVLGLIVGGFALLLSLCGPASARAAACAHENAKPGEATSAQFEASIKCLVDKERNQRGLGDLQRNNDLKSVERSHVDLMLRKDCFKHRCAGEKSLTKRIKRSGYLDGADSFSYGENLGYEETPKQMIKRFMADRYHRHNILLRKADQIGVTADRGAPVKGVKDSDFVTYGLLIAGREP